MENQIETPMEVETPVIRSRDKYNKSFSQKNGCRFVNSLPNEQDVSEMMNLLNIGDNVLQTSYFKTHIINFPWRFANNEEVMNRFRNLRFQETSDVIMLWVDTPHIGLATSIMESWGVQPSSIRTECILDCSNRFMDASGNLPNTTSLNYYGENEKEIQEVEVVEPVSEAEAEPVSLPEATEFPTSTPMEMDDTSVQAPKRRQISRNGTRRSFETVSSNIPPSDQKTIFRPTCELLLVGEIQSPSEPYMLKRTQSKIPYSVWKMSNEDYSNVLSESRHPNKIKNAIYDSISADQAAHTLQWMDSGDFEESLFHILSNHVPGYFYVPTQYRPKHTSKGMKGIMETNMISDLITMLIMKLSKKLTEQQVKKCLDQTRKYLSNRTSPENKELYKTHLFTTLVEILSENRTIEIILPPGSEETKGNETAATAVPSSSSSPMIQFLNLCSPLWNRLKEYLLLSHLSDEELEFRLDESVYRALRIVFQELFDKNLLAKTPKKVRRKSNGSASDPTKEKKPCGFRCPCAISNDLADFLGYPHGTRVPRTEIVKQISYYIKTNGLQLPDERQFFIPDETLAKIVGHEKLSFFSVQKELNNHCGKAFEVVVTAAP